MIQAEIEKEENCLCAECFSLKPEYVSLNLGVFVCNKCSKYHKKLSVDRNTIVAVRGHQWTEDEVNFIRSRGNIVVNQTFEKYLPKYYHRPDPNDPTLIREQFIKAKYEREEFKDTHKQKGYNEGSKSGLLYKRGKDNDKFLQRKFVLKEPDGCLEYYIKSTDKTPKDTIIVRNLVNIFMVPEKVGNTNGMQVTYEKDGVRRNLFLYGDNAKESSDWYHAIRASMVRHKFQNFPDEQMKKYLNTKIIREGWMSKTGPKRQEKFRKRYFSLVGTMVWYYTAPLDAHPLGFIPLGSRTFGYGVMKGLTSGIKVDGYGLTVHTPERIYALNCASLKSRDEWVKSINEVLDSCTTVWSQPGVGRLGSEKKELTPNNDADAKTNGSPNPSGMNNLLNNKRDSSSSTATSSSESPNSSTKQPLFEKKTNKGPAGGKYPKTKDANMKRKSSAKKIQDNTEERIDSVDDTNEDGHSVEEREVIASNSSNRNSDDSDHDSDDRDWSGRDSSSSCSDSDGSETYLVTSASTSAETGKVDDFDLLKEIETANPSNKTPKKPPRPRAAQGPSDSGTSDADSTSVTSQPRTIDPAVENEDPYSFAESLSTQVSTESQPETNNTKTEWNRNTFSKSVRNVGGHQRISVKQKATPQRDASIGKASSASGKEKEKKPRPVDVTLTNCTEKESWFVLFQSEVDIDEEESYVTPWIGAQIAECPASVGPMRIPPGMEIAVIDTAPGGFGLLRTTGPFFVEAGDVWEVEIIDDGKSPPELFFHEGMETDDGSVLVYANAENLKTCEVAVFRNGRKLFSRKNVKGGEAVSLKIKQALHFMAVDENTFHDIEEQDLKASEYIKKSSCIDINYRQPRMKVQMKKNEEDIIFIKVHIHEFYKSWLQNNVAILQQMMSEA